MSTAPLPHLLEALRTALAGQYEVERQLGAGGMGSVFLARDPTLDRHVAIKVISPELSASKTFRERFLLEARTVARLRHPNIVAVHAAGERDGLLYFVMECISGESLRELLDREGRCGGERGATILRDLANALDYAHEQGIVHRDIKPENVLLERGGGRALLTDFGVARALSGGDSRMTGTGFVVGSPRYMSPEQGAGDRETDGRSDVYSLGLVGYEMFAGEPAFSGPTAASIIVKQMTVPPTPLAVRAAEAPPRVAAAIDRALEKDPALRWQRAGEMARALEATAPGGTYLSSAERGRRGKRRIVVAALALLFAAVPTAWLALRARSGVPAGVDPRKSVLVAPFEIQSADQSIRWLREGSVNMLALNMAQWTDLKVVNYERSLDLLRDAGLDQQPRIGLAEARGMARRAGVWTVVMGLVNSAADSLIVRATLYDVASGRELDQAQRATLLRSDPRALYDELARELLDLVGAPPLSLGVARTTTSSLAAYRSYLDGVRFLNSWRLDAADSAFKRAIEADSTFALAYYKRTLTLGWRNPFDPEHLQSAESAVRHGERLPTREREIVLAYGELAHGLVAQQRGDTATAFARLADAQRRYSTLVKRDSSDAEAWYGLGDAYFHQAKPNHDPSATFTLALRAFNRTTELDSTFHLAYSHKILIYNSAGASQSGLMLAAGDSVYVLADSAARRAVGPERIAAAKVRARALAVRDARHWVELDPDAQQSYVALADTYTAAGFPDSAALVLERALARPGMRAPELAYRVASLHLAAGSDDALGALRLALTRYPADSLRRSGSYQRFPHVISSANVGAAAGSLREVRRVMATLTAADPRVPFIDLPSEGLARWYEAALQLAMGMPVGPLRRTIDEGIRYVDTIPTVMGTNIQGASTPVPYVAFLSTRDTTYLVTARRWAKGMGLPSLTELDALAALRAGDTTRAAALAREFPLPQPAPTNTFAFAGLRAMTRAEVLIELGELQRAITIYERLDPRRFTPTGLVDPGWALYPRSYLARAQVYEQLGDRAKAEASYSRFLDLWKEADPALQPQLQQARDALRRLRDAPGTGTVVR